MGVIVVPLPNPSLAVISEREEHGVPSSTTQCLNDDILREIANYLEWADQVALSTTSRHIHRLELPCLRQYTCETASQLQALYQYLTKDPITSTRRIARLGYLRLVCADYEAVLGSTKKLLQAVKDVLQITGTSTSLRRLEISYPTSIPREAGASLKHVTHVRFTSDESLPSPGAFPEALRSLHIGGHKKHMYLAISQLYLHLTRLPALSKLILDRVHIEDEDPEGLNMETGDDNGGSNDPIPSFPTIQTLRFLYCGYLTDTTELPLSKTFPNLSTLEIKGGPMGIEDYGSTTEHHLRSFIFDSFDEALPRLWSVDHITYTNPNAVHTVSDMYQVTSCDDLVSLRLRTNIEDPFFKWNDLAVAVPELRLLEIESYFTSTRETLGLLSEYVDGDTYFPIPLICITIFAPATENDCTTATPEEFIQTRDEFFAAAVEGMPTLRYVAYARREQRETLHYRVESEVEIEDYSGDRAPWQWWRIVRRRDRKPRSDSEDRSGGSENGSGNSDQEEVDEDGDEEDSDEDGDEEDSDEDGDEEDSDEDGDEEDSDEFVEVRQIPTWEGERVRTFLRNADMETAEDFDEIFKPLR